MRQTKSRSSSICAQGFITAVSPLAILLRCVKDHKQQDNTVYALVSNRSELSETILHTPMRTDRHRCLLTLHNGVISTLFAIAWLYQISQAKYRQIDLSRSAQRKRVPLDQCKNMEEQLASIELCEFATGTATRRLNKTIKIKPSQLVVNEIGAGEMTRLERDTW